MQIAHGCASPVYLHKTNVFRIEGRNFALSRMHTRFHLERTAAHSNVVFVVFIIKIFSFYRIFLPPQTG